VAIASLSKKSIKLHYEMKITLQQDRAARQQGRAARGQQFIVRPSKTAAFAAIST
jgi:hypothetical protein